MHPCIGSPSSSLPSQLDLTPAPWGRHQNGYLDGHFGFQPCFGRKLPGPYAEQNSCSPSMHSEGRPLPGLTELRGACKGPSGGCQGPLGHAEISPAVDEPAWGLGCGDFLV